MFCHSLHFKSDFFCKSQTICDLTSWYSRYPEYRLTTSLHLQPEAETDDLAHWILCYYYIKCIDNEEKHCILINY